jgi:hypothetical protein
MGIDRSLDVFGSRIALAAGLAPIMLIVSIIGYQ